MAIEVFATPEAVCRDLRDSSVIVVDALRATSVMVTAIENGARFIVPTVEVDEAVDKARALGNQRVLLCGERNAKPIPEFHLSNSPSEYTKDMVSGRGLVMTTTNGTAAVLKARDAGFIAMGAFVNAAAVAKAVVEKGGNIAIVCAGTKGKFTLDDILCAGCIIDRILALDDQQYMDDLARTALTLYDSYKGNLRASLSGSIHAEYLRSIGLEEDITYCLQEDIFSTVPVYADGVIRGNKA